MNIKEAKQAVKEAVEIYLEKDKNGEYLVPTVRQRPLFLVGAPGIGKTAIMEQVAAELDIALVSYSMTHHTRQSAIGLPYLKEVEYGGKQYTKSEYTMSEIVASVYEVIEKTGKKEGILFLDEINCVSETLAPAMLQFLQYKKFGNQTIPEGWVVVTAGNPPQYNKSAKEFDVATQDRLKMVDVEASFSAWKEYAYNAGIHPAVMAFLELNGKWFYSIKTTVDGKQYITARGWEDLSSALQAYERHGFAVDDALVMQYITDKECARKFTVYYNLFREYRMDYPIESILSGDGLKEAAGKAQGAKFDERLAVVSMLMERLGTSAKETMTEDAALQEVVKRLRVLKKSGDMYAGLAEAIHETKDGMEKAKAANALSDERKDVANTAIRYYTKYQETLAKAMTDGAGNSEAERFGTVKETFSKDVKAADRMSKKTQTEMKNAFQFVEAAWGDTEEMTLFATEVTMNRSISSFITRFGCNEYFKNNGSMLVYDTDAKLTREIDNMLAAV